MAKKQATRPNEIRKKGRMHRIGGLRKEHRQMLVKALRMAPVPSLTVEIGSLVGRSAVFIVEWLRKLGREDELLYCIEPNARVESSGLYRYGPADRVDFYKNIVAAGVGRNCVLVGLPSLQAARAFDDNTIGMLYVDGTHVFQPVCDDIEAFVPKVIPGAPILFDDYVNKSGYGVIPAVQVAVELGMVEVIEQFDTQILCRRPA